ncbi:MAG: formyltransferase family protein [Patescibacteria group bacterium]
MYKTNSGQLLRVVVFFSGGASSLKYLLARDPNLGKKYQIVGAFTNKENTVGAKITYQWGIPIICLGYRQWCRKENRNHKDEGARKDYFAEVCRLIKNFETDIILLSGFMMIITDPLLSEYRSRILNVHPANTTIKGENGKTKYAGDNAVEDAIKAGEKSTCSTVHVITEEVDNGPVVALSESWPVIPGIDPAAHQGEMKWVCDGPAYVAALERISSGEFPLD